MPIRAFLDAHSFDGETVRLMNIGFEMALGSLRTTPDHADPVREAVARKITELAKAGERDPERKLPCPIPATNRETLARLLSQTTKPKPLRRNTPEAGVL